MRLLLSTQMLQATTTLKARLCGRRRPATGIPLLNNLLLARLTILLRQETTRVRVQAALLLRLHLTSLPIRIEALLSMLRQAVYHLSNLRH